MENQILGQQQECLCNEYEICLRWDDVMRKDSEDIDLDLQCVILDDLAQIEDAVYYNQLTSNIINVSLSDDQRGASQKGLSEIIKINFQNANFGIKYLAILVCSHNGHFFNSVETAYLEVKANQKVVLSVSIGGQGNYTSYVPCIFSKQSNGTWMLNTTDVADKSGKTFLECEDLIKKGLLKCGFDEGLLQEAKNWNGGKKSFNLKKEDILLIPDAIADNEIFVGLGWDTRCDIDSSIITYDAHGNLIENIYYGNLRSKNGSIVHQGDNLTGVGDGDDEVIRISLNKLDKSVNSVWSIITIYTDGKTFKDVSGTFCRLIDAKSKKEFCKYDLSQSSLHDGITNGCIMACIKRYKNNQWAIQPLGYFTCGQRTSSGVAPIVRNVIAGNLSQVKIINNDKNKSQVQQQQSIKKLQTQTSSISSQKQYKQISNIKALDISSLGKNTYAIIKVNKTRIGQTEKTLAQKNLDWQSQFTLPIKEGDYIKIKIYNYAKMFFDDFLGKVKILVNSDILNNNSQNIKLKILDKSLKENHKFPGYVEFKLSSN